MAVSLRHLQRCVTKHLLKLVDAAAIHQEITRESMASVVKPNRLHVRLFRKPSVYLVRSRQGFRRQLVEFMKSQSVPKSQAMENISFFVVSGSKIRVPQFVPIFVSARSLFPLSSS